MKEKKEKKNWQNFYFNNSGGCNSNFARNSAGAQDIVS
jgi:hypothetical protein